MVVLLECRVYRKSEPFHTKSHPGGRFKAGRPRLVARVVNISVEHRRTCQDAIIVESRRGPEVCALFHNLLAGEKGQRNGFLLVGAAATVLFLTRCSAWEGGWLGRCRRVVVRSAFFEWRLAENES